MLYSVKTPPWLKSHTTAISALLPCIIFFSIFAIYPFFYLIRLSFSNTVTKNSVFISHWSGYNHFTTVLTDPSFYHTAIITIIFIVATVISSVVLGLFLAILVSRSVIMRPLAQNILVWPAVLTPVVISVLWLMLLSPSVGILNKIAESLGFPTQSILNSEAGAFLAIIILDIWHWTPLVFLFFTTALNAISRDIYEAADLDGATSRQLLWNITLPLLRPTIAVIVLIRLIMSVKAFDEMFLLTRGGPNDATNLISLQIRNKLFGQFSYGYGSAESLIVLTAIIFIILIGFSAQATYRKTRLIGI